MNLLEQIDMVESYIRTCHRIMTVVPDMDSKKHWARQGLNCKPILKDLKDKLNYKHATTTYRSFDPYDLQRFLAGDK